MENDLQPELNPLVSDPIVSLPPDLTGQREAGSCEAEELPPLRGFEGSTGVGERPPAACSTVNGVFGSFQ
jgi:hypothetical protein